MGKVSKWFSGLLSLKKPDSSSPSPTTSVPKPPKEKRKWSFVKSYRQNDNLPTTATVETGIHNNDSHTIAVAAASAIRLRSGGGCFRATVNREEWAAVKIQATFRGFLARRALRALKGLVKLQALVRGQLARKRTAERLQKMQLLFRVQAGRLRPSSIAKSSNVHLHTVEFVKTRSLISLISQASRDHTATFSRSKSMKYDQSSILKISGNKEKCWKTTDSWVDEKSWNRQRSSVRTCVDDERNVRILEMDSEKRNFPPKRRARNLFHTTNLALVSVPYSQTLTTAIKNSTIHHSGPIPRGVHQSYSPPEGKEVDETPFCTANNSPQLFSGSSRDGSSKRSPFTPSRSDGSRSYVSGYSECPNYMAYTDSSKAKVRSLSVPKQRTRYERSGSSNRYTMNEFGESRLASQKASALHASFTNNAYPGSGRLEKSGLHMGYRY